MCVNGIKFKVKLDMNIGTRNHDPYHDIETNLCVEVDYYFEVDL